MGRNPPSRAIHRNEQEKYFDMPKSLSTTNCFLAELERLATEQSIHTRLLIARQLARDFELRQARTLEACDQKIKQLSLLAIPKKHDTGSRGEHWVAKLIDGHVHDRFANCYDIITKTGLAIEVKTSLLHLVSKYKGNLTKRWAWCRVSSTSRNGDIRCDRFLLLGEHDHRYDAFYRVKNSSAPYIIFDVPIDKIDQFSIQTGKKRSIHLLTNPAKARSVASPIFEYEISGEELQRRYS